MIETLEPEPENIFRTSNRKFARRLWQAGCTLIKPISTYDIEHVKHHSELHPEWRLKGKPMEDGVQKMVDEGLPARTIYYEFRRDQIFEEALAAEEAIVKAVCQAKEDGVEPILPEVDHVTVMRVLTMFDLNLPIWEKLPFKGQILCSTMSGKRTPSGDGKMVHVKESGKVWSLNLRERNPDAHKLLMEGGTQ